MKHLVAVYSSVSEVIILEMGPDGPIGKENWFGKDNRDYDDYDLEIGSLPLQIEAKLGTWGLNKVDL